MCERPEDDGICGAVGGRPRASWAIGAVLLVACGPRQVAPVAVPAPTAVAPVPAPSVSPPSTSMPTADAPSSSAASSVHVIVPASGEARVHDLVLTALEVREEQHDQDPDHGDVLMARLHVRRVGSAALSAADMAAQLPALVTVRSSDGAEGSRWQGFRFVVTGGDRMAVVLTVTPIPTANSLAGTPLKLAADQGAGTAAGLAVTVIDVVEKRTMEGNSMMRVTLHLRRAGTPAPTAATIKAQEDSVVTLTSDPGDDVVTWRGFRIGYLGGWRTEVELRIVPP